MSKKKSRVSTRSLKAIEWARIKKIKEEWESDGYLVLTNRDFHTGVDLIIIDTEPATFGIARVMESTNWNKRGYLQDSRFQRYLNDLNRFAPTEREIVFSYDSNLTKKQKKEFEKWGIIVTIKGYQD